MDKKCYKCHKLFPKEELTSGGYCKPCNKSYRKEYYSKNKDKYKGYREKVRDKTIIYLRNYYSTNKEILNTKYKVSAKKWYELNKDKKVARQKVLRTNNPKYEEYYKKYNIDNRDRINAYNRTYTKNRRETDPEFKIATNLRARFVDSLKVKGLGKHSKTLDLLGCSIRDFRIHLESQFHPLMNWENYGKVWHIDHIIPCSKFNLSLKEEQQRCFHFSNTQPLFISTRIIDDVEYIGNLNKNNQLFMFENITTVKFKELLTKGYSIDMMYILCLLKDNIDISTTFNSVKINSLVDTLYRKGLVDMEYHVTIEGDNLIKFINNISETDIKLVRIKTDDEFEKFWKVFPSTDTFEYKGRKFVGNRALRINKEGCKLKLKSILNSGEYTIDQLVAAINYDVTSKKEASVKSGTNKLSYIQNAATYLNQLAFEPFIELIKQGATIQETEIFKNGTDI